MPESQPASSVLTFEQAMNLVLRRASEQKPIGQERVPLLHASGRILANDIHADRDYPPFPRATRDGYAVIAADSCAGAPLRLVGEVRAGTSLEDLPTVGNGEAAEIMTGAPVPPGADAVVMVEYTKRSGAHVSIERGVTVGENIVPAGSEGHAGEVVLPAGTRLDYAAVSVAASVGWASPEVYARPRVMVLPTGDEVVDLHASPGHHQIRNSNSYSLATQITAAGGDPFMLPVAPDERGRLHHLLSEGLEADLLLLSGGVSMGKYDLVEEVLAEFDARFAFTGVQIQPGKPLVFGDAVRPSDRTRRVPVFGLPGNPVSTMVTFELFVRPFIAALSGAKPHAPVFLKARLRETIRTKTGLTRFLPGRLTPTGLDSEVQLVRWQGSGDVVATASANCYIVVPPDRAELPAGESVSILLRGVEI